MVLTELGVKLTGALRKLNASTVITDDVLKDVLKDICRALMESDVAIQVVKKLRDNIMLRVDLEHSAGGNKQRLIQKTVFDELVAMLDPGKPVFKPKKGKSNVILFVGLQGAGKTTTIAKYARHYKQKGMSCALCCCDTFRAAAFAQLRQNAARIHVPFYGSFTEPDPVKLARDGVQQFRDEGTEVILVDTSGRHKQESALFEEMQEVMKAVAPDDIVFVMDSTIGQAAASHAQAFKEAVPVGSVIITKLDGHAKGGGALSAVAQTGAPIAFYGTGEHFDDLEPFNARSFVSRLLGYGDMSGLIKKFDDVIGLENQEAMLKNITQGVFSMRDMYDQFQNVLKLGPLNKVMDMLPAQMGALIGAGGAKEGGNRIRRFLTMMDSMSDKELDGIKPLDPKRVRRIAMGSGTSVQEVNLLVMCHKKFAKMFGKLGKSSLLKGGDSRLKQQMARSPAGVMQQLSRSMDPRMLAQMGGASNLMGMMKSMSNMNPADMEGMMGGMGGAGGGGLASMMASMGRGAGGKRRGRK